VACEDKVTFAIFLPNAADLKCAVTLRSEFLAMVGMPEKCGSASITGDIINAEPRVIKSVKLNNCGFLGSH
jgi:hypothetical protein